MRRLANAATLTAIAVLVPATAAAAALPAVLTQERPAFQVRPAVISYTGDGTGFVGGLDGTSVKHLGHLQWTTYNSNEGQATGKLWLNNCTPDCAAGTFSSVRVSVHVSSPSHGRFQRLTLRYGYHGKRYTDRRVIHFYSGGNGARGFWAYAIAG